MPKLTEIRLVTDNGRQTMDMTLRHFFNPERRTFLTVKSLFVRTTTHIAGTFRCFPNLEAINFNIHGSTKKVRNEPFSQEVRALMFGAAPQLRTLAILKTANGGWTVDDISGRHNSRLVIFSLRRS
jgi:hypothetical protein